MSEGQRRRARRRRKVVKHVKKTFLSLVFAPTRIPKIKQDTVEMLMRLCEGTAITFAATLVAHIVMPELIGAVPVVLAGIAFTAFLAVIKLSDYQEKYEPELFNLEATPAESTAFRFAKHDKERFPDILTAHDGGTPYYTNSTNLPVGSTDDVFDALDVQDRFQPL